MVAVRPGTLNFILYSKTTIVKHVNNAKICSWNHGPMIYRSVLEPASTYKEGKLKCLAQRKQPELKFGGTETPTDYELIALTPA